MHFPGRIAHNSGEQTREVWLEELADLDGEIRELAGRCDAELQGMVLAALELTRVGGSALEAMMAPSRDAFVIATSKFGDIGEGDRLRANAQVRHLESLGIAWQRLAARYVRIMTQQNGKIFLNCLSQSKNMLTKYASLLLILKENH